MSGSPVRRSAVLAGMLAIVGALTVAPIPTAAQGRTHVLLVVGLGGTADYRAEFHSEAVALRTALIQRHGIPTENVTYLGERVDVAPEAIADRSTRENILATLAEIAGRAAPLDRLLVILIGHGTTARDGTSFNLPGPDITPSDFRDGLATFPTQTLALVLTGSGSGGFLEPLSGPNRIIIAATRSERELDATQFGQYFADAIAGDGADLDKDDRISLLEAFQYAKREVERHYGDENELVTEHAVLDDDGDGQGSIEASLTGPDGPLASTFQLGGVSGTAGQLPDDPALRRLYEERNGIQERVGQLRAVRGSMAEDAYLTAMEDLLVELALKNREIRAIEDGGPA